MKSELLQELQQELKTKMTAVQEQHNLLLQQEEMSLRGSRADAERVALKKTRESLKLEQNRRHQLHADLAAAKLLQADQLTLIKFLLEQLHSVQMELNLMHADDSLETKMRSSSKQRELWIMGEQTAKKLQRENNSMREELRLLKSEIRAPNIAEIEMGRESGMPQVAPLPLSVQCTCLHDD